MPVEQRVVPFSGRDPNLLSAFANAVTNFALHLHEWIVDRLDITSFSFDTEPQALSVPMGKTFDLDSLNPAQSSQTFKAVDVLLLVVYLGPVREARLMAMVDESAAGSDASVETDL